MKLFLAFLVFSTVSVAAPTGKNKILPVTKEEEALKKEKIAQEKLKKIMKEKEDCDEKAKKPVEVAPETISLTGNTGCTIE